MQSNKNEIYGVIMAGGFGERLWPLSRKTLPKYCICIGDKKRNLLQQAYDRLREVTSADKIFVVTHKAQAKLIRKYLPQLGSKNIISEPSKKNTAAAIGLAALTIGKISPDAVMIVVPADHFIPKKDAFRDSIKNAVKTARENNSLVTIGIKPTCPATGYGYIEKSRKVGKYESKKDITYYKVEKFVEKPDLYNAKKFIKSGYLWNSGMFVWEVTTILQALRDYVPELFKGLMQAESGKMKLSSVYDNLESISIDNAVLEKAKNVYVVPGNFAWDDVGSWLSFARIMGKGQKGNIADANLSAVNTEDCLVISKDKKHLIAMYGLKDIIVIKTNDVTLICSKDSAENIRELVNVSDKRFR